MKKLILLLFLTPNLAMAETWVCSHVDTYDKIKTTSLTRTGDKFISKDGSKNKIYYEDRSSITLTFTHGVFGFNAAILNKVNKTFVLVDVFKRSDDERYGVLETQGSCEVVE